MLLDYEIAPCTRRCAATGRALAPGEAFYSTLHVEGGAAVRRDYASDAWTPPPEGVVAWWQSRPEATGENRSQLAPTDALLDLFAALAEQPGEAEFRYVLGLLLLRRRLVKLDRTREDVQGEVLVLDCPRRQEQFELPVAAPPANRLAEHERRLGELLYGGAAGVAA